MNLLEALPVKMGAMKNFITPLITLLVLVTSGVADAAPWSPFGSYRAHESSRHDSHYDRDRDSRDYRRDDRRRPMRLEARVQLRLRELGFYRGPIDGSFGRGSRYALSRFQHSRGLRPSGVLTESTIRALRL